MVKSTKQILSKVTNVISASEIGQYHYCSMSWILQKCGYKPKSPNLAIGVEKHVALGNVIERTQVKEKKSKILAITGYLLLITASIIAFFEVIPYL